MAIRVRRLLCLERDASADLVASLIELLRVEREAETEGEALVDLCVVAEGEDTAVVDLGLGERHIVNLVSGGNLEANARAVLRVVDSLARRLDDVVDLLVERRSEYAKVVCRRHGAGEGTGAVARRESISCQGRLLDIERRLTADKEALVGKDSIGRSLDVTGGRGIVAEDAGVCRAVLEVQRELLTLVEAGLGAEVCEKFGLDAIGDDVVEFDLRGGVAVVEEGLSDSQACGCVL
jgi:hypothetical protein